MAQPRCDQCYGKEREPPQLATALPRLQGCLHFTNCVILAKKRRSMEDIQDQLAALRRQLARIDRKYTSPSSASARPKPAPAPAAFIENLISGEVVETGQGRH